MPDLLVSPVAQENLRLGLRSSSEGYWTRVLEGREPEVALSVNMSGDGRAAMAEWEMGASIGVWPLKDLVLMLGAPEL